jgi:pilus assembly protein CpaB
LGNPQEVVGAGSGGLVAIARRPWWSRASAGWILMLAMGLAAFVANLAVLRSADDAALVAVAARDLAAGTVLSAGDLRLVEMDAGPDLLATLLAGDRLGDAEGRVLVGPVEEGALVARSWLREPAAASGRRAISLPVDPEHAVGGTIVVGDRVDVIAVADEGARYVVVGAEVLAVPDRENRGLAGTAAFYVVIAVDAETALAVSEALHSGAVEVVRSTGAAPLGPPPPGAGD